MIFHLSKIPITVSLGGRNEGLSVVVGLASLSLVGERTKSSCAVREGMSIRLSSLLPLTITPLFDPDLTHAQGSLGSSFENPIYVHIYTYTALGL